MNIYSSFAQAHLKLVVISPQLQSCVVGYSHSPLVGLSQGVHLLHVLPVAAPKYTRSGLEHLNIVEPQLSSVDIETNGIEHKFIGLCDGLAVLAILVCGEVEATADEVDVSRVNTEILRRRYGTTEEMLDLWQLIQFGFEVDILDPCLALVLLVKSHKTHTHTYSSYR